jgi:hypothetical protein
LPCRARVYTLNPIEVKYYVKFAGCCVVNKIKTILNPLSCCVWLGIFFSQSSLVAGITWQNNNTDSKSFSWCSREIEILGVTDNVISLSEIQFLSAIFCTFSVLSVYAQYKVDK